MFGYETLRLLWWVLLGVLLMGFAIMDGFDMGAMALMPFLGRNNNEKRVIISTVGPVWEGNQVWLIVGAGSIFAAWPYLYAVAFSGFYFAMFIVLFSLILRPVSFKFRDKMPGAFWCSAWDVGLFLSGIVPPMVFGVAFGNALQGVPFVFDETMRMTYKGGFFDLLNPFALICGLIGLSMFILQGASWLAVKTEGGIEKRARKASILFVCVTLALFAIAGLWAAYDIEGYRIVSAIHPLGPSNPMLKTAERAAGAWMDNYRTAPMIWCVPLLAFIGGLITLFGVKSKMPSISFIGSSFVQIGIIGTAGVSMFPFLLPSSADPNASLTIWDASSSRATLLTMAIVVAVLLPIVLAYTAWVYHILRGKITVAMVKSQADNHY